MEDRHFLISDVDNTLLGDDDALVQFAAWYENLDERPHLAYCSGRFYASVCRSIETTALPVPDVIIGGVGTEIHLVESGTRVAGWPENAASWERDAIEAVLVGHKELERQPDELQSDFKLSFYGRDLEPAFLAHLERQLTALGHRVEIVYSSNRDLDVLPPKTNKGYAAAFLARCCKAEPHQVIVCGDSGNDLSMFQQGFRGVVVGNAHQELRALSEENIYHSVHHFAAGVLDGVQYWLNGDSRGGSESGAMIDSRSLDG
ncbi:MAG: HAD-IIB family hydrolase [Planctomycetota bacterium]|nr:MAG: HAD-IIB family hydrolase [Planctomycetota bacterium]REJ95388.1 MAG: HAD-IIB family hydrolase [Planctomycetota bacterium]REK17588.1 MAG: HAD-IIB family hydrolase [Planctomycetota bacterium]REK39821.1 MAG: HAD-IIB family hydrolase [Planctomycetota bacterium]